MPAGNPDGGQWTDAVGANSDILAGTSGAGTISGGDQQAGYPIDILQEDVIGGHTFARHINKTEEYLKARILENRRSIRILGLELRAGEKRAGSFTSLEAANKLVNSVLAEPQNQEKLKALWKDNLSFSFQSCTYIRRSYLVHRRDTKLTHRMIVPSPS